MSVGRRERDRKVDKKRARGVRATALAPVTHDGRAIKHICSPFPLVDFFFVCKIADFHGTVCSSNKQRSLYLFVFVNIK